MGATQGNTILKIMPETRECILFVPGMGVDEPEQYLEKLVAGLRGYCDAKAIPFQITGGNQSIGSGQREVRIEKPDGATKVLEIRECYWGDYRPTLSDTSVINKALGGLELLFYWLKSPRMWRRAWRSKYMLFHTIFTLVLILIWYYGALTTALSTIEPGEGSGLWHETLAFLAHVGKHMGGWEVWAASAVLMFALPVVRVIDIAHGSRHYLTNVDGVFHKICGRVGCELMWLAKSASRFDRIRVLAHSFGAVVVTEALAMRAEPKPEVDLFVLGGPLEIVAARSPRVQEALDKLLTDPSVKSWTDFHSGDDWFCAATPVPDGVAKFQSRPLSTEVSMKQKLNGESHSLYFSNWEVMKALVDE